MTIDRTTVIQGPALVTFAGQTFWSKGDITLRPVIRRLTVATAHAGRIDDRNVDIRFEVDFEPSGEFTAALAAVLWPYASALPGTSIYGATDRPLVIHGRDGVKCTLHNAALTQMPAIRIGTGQTIVGPVKFTALCANDSDPADETSYLSWDTAEYPGDSGFDPSKILTAAPVLSYGTESSILTEAGVEITFALSLTDVAVDGTGTVDMRVAGVDVTASCVPVNLDAEDIANATHRGMALGSAPNTFELVVATDAGATGDPLITIPAATLDDAEIAYGPGRKRVGRVTWKAMRTFTAGVAGALFTVAAVTAEEPEEPEGPGILISGITDPTSANGFVPENGTFNGKTKYDKGAFKYPYVLWNDKWYIITAPADYPDPANGFSKESAAATPVGLTGWTALGTATGAPVIAAVE